MAFVTTTTILATRYATPETPEECGACHHFFPTLADVFSHPCDAVRLTPRPRLGEVIDRRGPREVVGNGFGGTTTRKADPIVPPTEKQVRFLRSLLAERAGVEAAEAIRVALNVSREAGTLSKRDVSKAIDALLQIARPAAPIAPFEKTEPTAPRRQVAPLPEVPEGRYALRVDGVVKFYVVDQPTEGKWAGWTFVKVQASDDLFPVKGEARRPILEAIAQDPAAAAALYGHELGVCGVCNRTLTDEESRARGIGPVCAQKRGW